MVISNPKTTLMGYLAVLASVTTFIVHLHAGTVSQSDTTELLGAVAGIGLVAAKDGGH